MCRVEKQGLPSFPLPITGRETLQLTSFMPEPAISLHLFHRFFTTFKSNFPLYCMSMSADELWYWRNSDGTCEADSASLRSNFLAVALRSVIIRLNHQDTLYIVFTVTPNGMFPRWVDVLEDDPMCVLEQESETGSEAGR
ncbi:hypothetical protein M8818_002257 [Zalaria obscura]|uniref:Uncharacterized protein n=1 Tax=Zalaria obscura TaxID=2024903 RepID=A0ACC3SIY0_9PEZI